MRKTISKDAWMKGLPGTVPRKKRAQFKPRKDLVIKESVIQKQAEAYLDVLKAKYIRIPDEAYRVLFATPSVPAWVAARLSSFFKGLPDLIIIKPSRGAYNDCLLLELKAKTGRLSQGQKKWHQGVNVQTADSFESAKIIIDDFYGKQG